MDHRTAQHESEPLERYEELHRQGALQDSYASQYDDEDDDDDDDDNDDDDDDDDGDGDNDVL
jgi:hypothetical protein